MFGVSSHEYLNYANANRDEWIRKGEEVVAGYLQKYSEHQEGDSFKDEEGDNLPYLENEMEV